MPPTSRRGGIKIEIFVEEKVGILWFADYFIWYTAVDVWIPDMASLISGYLGQQARYALPHILKHLVLTCQLLKFIVIHGYSTYVTRSTPLTII